MSRFLISCGGTGGHLAPGIAVAEGLVARGHGVRLLISEKRVDARLIEKYPQFEFTPVAGTGFGLAPAKLARFAMSQAKGFAFCRKLVRETKPDCVVSFGGFTSTGVVLAARLRGVPVALHESNRVPGRAIRVLGRFAQRVYLPSGVKLGAVKKDVVRHVGMPVRREIVPVEKAAARASLGLNPEQKVVVVFGGSQGATVLNDWARKEMGLLAAEGVQVCCVTGLGKGAEEVVELKSREGAVVRARFIAFSDRVGELLSAADLVVARAGAGTIAELIRCETPAVLVPFPQAADDHQRANAAEFARDGGGFVVEQRAMEELTPKVLEIVLSEARLEELRVKLRRMGRENPVNIVVEDVEALAGKGAGAR
jgi:UDP-N-acetylglucosamine--N-acetylmuramyl-(pentapeptide) pyrophosphoryl-undecaprenol N-acetylglucosamine transferase